MNDSAPVVQMIPVDQINILNPRSRNKVIFQSIISNISGLGLKKPITVARRAEPTDGKAYDLVCGQGRLEAFIALEQTEIPAIVIDAAKEECFLMSLVENIARRNHSPLELLREISKLKARGYKTRQIAKKIDLDRKLRGWNLATCWRMARNACFVLSRRAAYRCLSQCRSRTPMKPEYNKRFATHTKAMPLRGRKLQTVRRIIDLRKAKGKRLTRAHTRRMIGHCQPKHWSELTARRQTDRSCSSRRPNLTENRLLFVVSALRKLFGDENFVTLLRAEGLDRLPAYLAGRKSKISERG